MDSPITISPEAIRNLRNSKAWSQQHLADAAGLSLRTIQRIEAEGTASAETRLAIAAALDASVEVLAPKTKPNDQPSIRAAGSVLVFASSSLGALFVLWFASQLPDTVASHFGFSGAADGRMSREIFVAVMCTIVVSLPAFVWWILERTVRLQKIDIPNASYWLSIPQRQRTERFLLRHTELLCIGLTAFMCFVFWMVATANTSSTLPAKLDIQRMLAGLGGLLAFVIGWMAVLIRRFPRIDT
jgi:transcriptional regulator with XRE-family HTH domain